MDTTNVNTAIDDKKNENSGESDETKSSNWGGFISSLIMIIIHLLLWLGFIGPLFCIYVNLHKLMYCLHMLSMHLIVIQC